MPKTIKIQQYVVELPCSGSITGRNGTFDITKLSIWGDDDVLFIEGISKSNRILNGGLKVQTSVFLDAAIQLLSQRLIGGVE